MPTVETETLFAQAARPRLRRTLRRIRRKVQRAQKENCVEPETIHRLRVATRRGQVAIDLYAHALPEGLAGRVRRKLVSLRRGAGKLRDLDVLLDGWSSQPTNSVIPPAAIQYVTRRRAKAVRKMQATLQQVKKWDLEDHLKRLVRKVRWRGELPEPTFVEAAARLIQPIASEFFQRGQQKVDDYEDLHQFRIAGKKLRYALATLSDGLESGFVATHSRRLSQLQEQLGQLNDHHSAWQRLARWAERAEDRTVGESLETLATRELELRNQLQQSLLDHWNPEGIRAWEQQFEAELAAPQPAS